MNGLDVTLALDPRKYVQGTRQADRATDRFGKTSRRTAKAIGLMKRQLAGFVAAYLGTRAIQQAVRDLAMFEAGLIGVGKTANIEGRQLQVLGGRIDRMSRRIPVATDELLGIAQAAGQLGVQGGDNILRFTETVARLGSASDLAGEEGATALARILNVTGESVESVDVLASVIVALGNNFAATERQIAHHTGEVARATAVYDLGSAQAAAFGTTLAAFGVRAELSGSAVGRSFRTIEDAVKSGGEKLETLARVSRASAEEVRAAWEENPVEAFSLFLQGIREVIDEGGNVAAVLETVGLKGEEILKVIPVLAKEYDSLAKALGLASEEQAGNTALMTESEKAFESFQSQLNLLGNEASSARRLFAAGLAPAIKEAADRARAWVSENRDEIRQWGETAGEALSVVVDLLAFVVDNIDLLVAALKIWIAVKVVSWIQPVIAHLIQMELAIKAGYGQLVLMNSAQGFRGLLSLPVVSTMKSWALGIGGVTAALVALGLGLDKLIDKWRELNEERIKLELSGAAIEGVLFDLQRAIRSTGSEIEKELFDKATTALEAARDRVASLQQQIDDWESERGFLEGVFGEPEDIQDARIELDRANATLRGLRDALAQVQVKAEDTFGKDGSGDRGGFAGVGGLSKDLQELVKEKQLAIQQTRFLAEAASISEEAFAAAEKELRVYNAAIEAGLDPLSKMGQRVMGLERILIAWEERLKFSNETMADFRRNVEEINRAADDFEIKPIGADQGTSGGLLDPRMVAETIKKAKAQHEGLTRDLEKIWDNLIEGIQRAAADAFTDLITGVVDMFRGGTFEIEDLFKSLWNTVVDLAIRAAAEAAAAWAAQKFAVNFSSNASGGGGFWQNLIGAFGGGGSGSAGGGGAGAAGAAGGSGAGAAGAAGGSGAFFTSSSGAGFFASGAGWASVVGAALVAYMVWADRKRMKEFQTALTFEVSGSESVRQAMGSMHEVVDGIESVVQSIEDLTGGTITDLPKIALRIRRDGERFGIIVADTYLGIFDSLEEAIGVGLRSALLKGQIEGVADEIQQVLQAPVQSLEELMANFELVQGQLDFDMTDFERSLKSFLESQQHAAREFERLGVSTGVVWDNTIEGLKRFGNELLGIEEDANAERLRNLEAYNRNRNELEAKLRADLLQAQQDLARAMQAQAALASGAAELGLRRLQSLAAQIPNLEALIQQIERDLASLPDPIDPAELPPLGGGGQGTRRADRDRLRSILDDWDRSQLGGAAAAIAEINAKWGEHAELAHGNADLLKRVAGARREEIDALKQQAVIDPVLEFEGPSTGGTFGQSGFEQEAAEARARFEQIRADNQAILEETGERAIAFWRINRAEIIALREIGEEAIDSLGTSGEQLRDRFATLGDTIDFLEGQVEDGILSAERFGQAMAELAQQEFLAFGDSMVGFLDRYFSDVEGYEEFRRRLEQIRFNMELTNLKFQFTQLKNLGLLTKEQIAATEAFFKWADDNMPDFGNVVPIASHPNFGGSSEIDRARDLLDRYQNQALDPLSRALQQVEEDFQFLRQTLGNTAEVQEAYAAAIERVMRQHLEGILRLQEDLLFGEGSILSPRQQLDQAQAAFEDAMRRFQAGDLSVIQEIPGIVQRYLQIARDFFPAGSAQYEQIFGQINRFLQEVLASGGLSGVELPAGAGVGAGAGAAAAGPGVEFGPPVPAPAPAGVLGNDAGLAAIHEGNMELRRMERHLSDAVHELRVANRSRARRGLASRVA